MSETTDMLSDIGDAKFILNSKTEETPLPSGKGLIELSSIDNSLYNPNISDSTGLLPFFMSLGLVFVILGTIIGALIRNTINSLIIAIFYGNAIKKEEPQLQYSYGKRFGQIFFVGFLSILISLPTIIIPIPFVTFIVWAISFYILLRKKLIKDGLIEEKSKKVASNTLVWSLLFGLVIGVIVTLLVLISGFAGGTGLGKGAYDKQMEKSRDAQRITNITLIKSSVEEYFSEKGKYPTIDELKKYNIDMGYDFPVDTKEGEDINGCKFGYNYELSSDAKNYRISTCMENLKNNFASNDGGIYENKYEVFSEM